MNYNMNTKLSLPFCYPNKVNVSILCVPHNNLVLFFHPITSFHSETINILQTSVYRAANNTAQG